MENLNEFELQRQQLIARNRARLLALGIPEAVSGLARLLPTKAAPSKQAKAPRKAKEAAQPSRQSTRLRDQAMIARGEVPPEVEPGSELALFIIDGECPRCGKVLSSGHAHHLQSCKGPPEPPTEEEIAAQAEAYKSQQKEKLRQLELGGLVDFNPGQQQQHVDAPEREEAAAANAEPPAKRPRAAAAQATAAKAAEEEPGEEAAEAAAEEEEQQQKGKGKGRAKGKKGAAPKAPARRHSSQTAAAAAASAGSADQGPYAIFIVIGSTGNHYVVRLSDEKRSCTCMDHRIRRRDCKHIRLILEQLGVADAPGDWQQALQHQVSELVAADDVDVEMVKQAEARAAARKQKAAAKAAAQHEG